jgi:hypothetical protein
MATLRRNRGGKAVPVAPQSITVLPSPKAGVTSFSSKGQSVDEFVKLMSAELVSTEPTAPHLVQRNMR